MRACRLVLRSRTAGDIEPIAVRHFPEPIPGVSSLTSIDGSIFASRNAGPSMTIGTPYVL